MPWYFLEEKYLKFCFCCQLLLTLGYALGVQRFIQIILVRALKDFTGIIATQGLPIVYVFFRKLKFKQTKKIQFFLFQLLLTLGYALEIQRFIQITLVRVLRAFTGIMAAQSLHIAFVFFRRKQFKKKRFKQI